MGTQIELKTVAAGARGKGGRVYDGPDSGSRGGFHVAFAALALTGVALIKKLLWGREDAVAATEEQGAEGESEGSTATALAASPAFAPAASDDVDAADEEPYRDTPMQASARPRTSQARDAHDSDVSSGTGAAARLMHLKAVNDNSGGATIVPLPSAHTSQPSDSRPASFAGGGGAGGEHPPARGNGETAPGSAEEGGSASGSGTPAVTGSNGPEKTPADTTNGGSGAAGTERTNHAPAISRGVTLPALVANHALLIALGDLLQHASDADGDIMAVDNLISSSGALQDNGDGSWTFTPVLDDESGVLFTYDVTDGKASAPQTATLDLVPAAEPACGTIIAGSDGDDVIVGTPCADDLQGGSGHDVIYADAGHDIIHGGGGNDTIFGGDGDDVIDAGAGDDVVHAGSGNDIAFAGTGNDVVMGGDGKDVLNGEAGDDVLAGEAGNDVVIGGAGNDRFVAGGGNQTAAAPGEGGTQSDHDGAASNAPADAAPAVLSASSAPADPGCDPVAADTSASVADDQAANANGPANLATAAAVCDPPAIACASDAQTATAAPMPAASMPPSDGDDVYDGGAGADTLDLSQISTDTFVDLASGVACGAEIGQDRLVDIENVVCGSGDDTIVDSSSRNVLCGGDGDDRFVFNGLDDASGDVEDADQIVDFEPGDRIDVSRIEASDDDGSRHSMEFLGEISADIQELLDIGKLGFRFETSEDGEHTVIYGRTGSSEFNDFIVDLIGRHDLSAEDFYGLR